MANDFPLPLRQDCAPPLYQRPRTLITFSYDERKRLHIGSNDALRYFSEPPQGADLKYGYERWIKKPEERGRLDSLLECLEQDGVREKSLARQCIVTWRGIMTRILIAPYEDRDGWELNAMLVNDIIFIEEHSNDHKLREKENMTPQHRLMSYFGYSFESFCTSHSPRSNTSGWGGDVNTNIQHCHIVKTKLGSSRLIIGGEVDCAKGHYNGETTSLMELKTSAVIRNANDEVKFEKKLLKFWAQSFLLGIPEVYVGFRSQDGSLQRTLSLPTLDIPRRVRGKGPHSWDGGLPLDFAERFLSFLRKVMASSSLSESDEDEDEDEGGHGRGDFDGAGKPTPTSSVGAAAGRKRKLREDEQEPTVWRIVFDPAGASFRGIRVMRLREPEALEEVRNGEDRVGFLPRAFYERLVGVDER